MELLAAHQITPLPIRLPTHPLTSNLFVPALKPGTSIHVYSMDYSPEVADDNRKLRGKLVASARQDLMALYGGFVVRGTNLFATKRIPTIQSISCRSNGGLFTLTLNLVRTVSMDCIQGKQDTMQVLNVVLKNVLRELGLKQVTRRPEFFSRDLTVALKDMEVWKGYAVEMTMRTLGPVITVDLATKILKTTTLRDMLQEYRSKGGEWKKNADRDLYGRIVMTTYGNNRCYRIHSIDFSKTPRSQFLRGSTRVTYSEYFRSQYSKTIEDMNQPLIHCLVRHRMQDLDVYLVPELVKLTGLSSEEKGNWKLMKTVDQHTRPSPADRFTFIPSLFDRINDSEGANSVLEDFSMSLPPQPLEVQAQKLQVSALKIGSSTIRVSPKSAFRVDGRICQPSPLRNWFVFVTAEYRPRISEFLHPLRDEFAVMGVEASPPQIVTYMPESFDENFKVANGSEMAVVMVSDRDNSGFYQHIKKTATTVWIVPSQVVRFPIPRERANTIIAKIALQIQAKVGGQLWLMQPIPAFSNHVMVVGVDVYHQTVKQKRSVLGFCATLDPQFSKYYSTTALHDTGVEIATVLGTLMLEALQAYKHRAGRYPETVIFFRDGVSESQVDAVKDIEVRSVLAALQSISQTPKGSVPKLIYTLVVKRLSCKFLIPSTLANPAPGTVITGGVLPSTSDFYLISHFANQGVATPTLYRTVYATNPRDFPLKDLAQLAYDLCHMYYNWTGAIKVPAPCMMAHKIAYLIGECVQGKVAPQLSEFSHQL